MTTHRTQWDEQKVLDYFWLMGRESAVDRLELLRQLTSVALARPSDWDVKAIRQAAAHLRAPWGPWRPATPVTLQAEACWTCLSRERRLYWHHVITVAHGGSSTPRNLVPLCHRCHGLVHPHLPQPTTLENRFGWTLVRDFVARALDRMAKAWGAPVAKETR